ncbi:hypothetical protein [Aestuariibacter sp. A3R04]|uniref:hypothetical protein n=1 Tax=Aestuariibacter sp. A3R04 TaxID=2841571 RepID=UPI001C0882DD|nr:hypothetical protein [Aestuariibacter sp. A3R04]MBU3023645.1 hypothetical protein [Aestuariibacter sp. A3R04]
MFVFSVLFFVALTVLAMMLSGNTGAFLDVPSLILTLPPALVFTVAVTSVGNVKEAFSSLLSSHAESIV